MIQTPGLLWTILFFLLAIGPLIFFHELGHYLVGRWCGVKADVFSIGFGREVAGWTDKRGTRWKVGWMPLGGYVRFAGDANAVSQPDEEWKELPDFERSRTFHAKPLWKRALIVAAGPITNFIIGFAIFAGLLAVLGDIRIPNTVGDIKPGSVAERTGFKVGDRIVRIGDREIADYNDIYSTVFLRPGVSLDFTVDRAGRELHIVAAPARMEQTDEFGNKVTRGIMGIGPSRAGIERVEVPAAQIPGLAFAKCKQVIVGIVDGIGQILFGNMSAKDISGPARMAKMSGEIATLGVPTFLAFVAFVSINLGFINLLPIPMLDGGHLFFYTIEGVIRRPVPPRAQEWAFRTGFVALMTLMLFVTFNDLGSFGLWQRLSGLIG